MRASDRDTHLYNKHKVGPKIIVTLLGSHLWTKYQIKV